MAFVVLQAADLTFEPLGLPGIAYRALVITTAVGLPVALALSWAFDIRAAGRSPLTRGGSLVAGAGLLLAIGAFGWFAAFRYTHADYHDNSVIAVLPFRVLGDPQLAYLESGMVELVSRNVDGVGKLRAVAPEMVLRAIGKEASPEAVGKRLGARYLVTGTVVRGGTELRMMATLQDLGRPGSRPRTGEVSGSADSLFAVIDRLSAVLLAATRFGGDAHLSSSAALSTHSLPALRAYLDGEEDYRRTRSDSAIAHFAQATALDSTFALAYYRIATAQLQAGRPWLGRDPAERAVRLSRDLSARDQGLVRALAAKYGGHWDQAERLLRELLANYPGDAELTYSLATLLANRNPRHGRSAGEAKPLFEQVARSDPESLCPI